MLTSAAGRAHAEQLFGALGARVTEPSRDQKYDSARVKIAHAAFLPSRIWSDTAVWTGITTSRRTLLVSGRVVGGRYRLEAAHTLPALAQLADSRHTINLTRLSDDEYAWDTEVGYALGNVSAAAVGAFVSALLASAEGRAEPDVRADYRATAPLTSAVLGQLFTVDSIRTTILADHSTLATFAVSMNPAGVESRYPSFAKNARRYMETARMHLVLVDRSGGTYFECKAGDGRLLMRVRTLAGTMVPLAGAARPMPDSLTLTGELTMKVRRFTVGFQGYRADFTIIRTPHERAWNLVSRVEPHWVLPAVTQRLFQTPLRRPFQGNGTLFRIGIRDDSTGAQTLLHRRMHLEVQESAILRFVGRLGSIAVSDFAGGAEREQNAWLREIFTAVVADIHNLGEK